MKMLRKILDNSEVRNLELDILKYIDKICKEHHIQYFLDYGTLLGAIRHKGFIPWDDDVDICMKRSDYERFVEIMSSADNARYRVLTAETDPHYFYEFAKVVDTHTCLEETQTIANPNMGVWVDVFPKDNLPKCHWLLKKTINFLVVLRIFSVFHPFPKHHSILFYPLWLIARLVGPRPFLKAITSLSTRWGDESPYVGDLIDIVSKRYCWKKEMFEEVVYVEFEGGKYPAPKFWDDYLKGLYNNYMQLPPEDKRKTHEFIAYLK